MLGSQRVVPVDPAGTSTELTLARHGQTEWHAENRYAGVSDVALDDVGRAQARSLAAWAHQHPHDVVACSPLRRARHTAAAVAGALGVEPEISPALREMDFGIAEGRTLDEVRRRRPDVVAAFLADPVHNPFPGAEPADAVIARVGDGLRALLERHRGRSVLVVGHNTALRLTLCHWLGIPVSRYRDVLPRLDNAAVTRLRVPADLARPPALLCLNVSTRPVTSEPSPATSETSETSGAASPVPACRPTSHTRRPQ